MKLINRVMTLIRANVNDLIDRAEDPEKMIKQLILDLNNQLIQVKTTVAQSLADQYIMEKRLEEFRKEAAASERRAQLAVGKGDDELARAALQKFNSYKSSIDETEIQLQEQRKETEALKVALSQLDMKITEVGREKDIILARQRRATAKEKMSEMRNDVHPERLEQLLDAISGYVDRSEAKARATHELSSPSEHRRLVKLEEDHKLDDQLKALKEKQSAGSAS